MFLGTIRQITDTGIRPLGNLNIRLWPHRLKQYTHQGKSKVLVLAEVRPHLVFEFDDGQSVSLDLPDLLPPEWEPGRTTRMTDEQLRHVDRSKTWLATSSKRQVISPALNKVATLKMRGYRIKAKYDSFDTLDLEVTLPMFSSSLIVDLETHPLKMFIQVK